MGGMKQVSHYEVLEVGEKASPEVIKAAYKSLMQRYHPDRNLGDAGAAERCVRIAQAYAVISDAGKRASYDQELNRRPVVSDSAEARARNILAVAARKEGEARYRWLWLLLPPFALGVVFFSFLYDTNPPISDEPKQVATALAGDERGVQTSPTYAIPAAARTIPDLFKDVRVSLLTASPADRTFLTSSGYELSIESISVVAGNFDPDKYMSFMESNREYIERKLIENLATADLMRLTGPDGERYLKRRILEALTEITGAEQSLSPSSSRTDRYGAEDILLPDSFSVTPPNSDL